MPWTVLSLQPVQSWLTSLDRASFLKVSATIKLLEEYGPQLGTPQVKKIESSRHANMKELRITHGNEHFRIFFAFDAQRQAILLTAGEKISFGVDAFYEHHVPKADDLLDIHQASLPSSKPRKKSVPHPRKKSAPRGKNK